MRIPLGHPRNKPQARLRRYAAQGHARRFEDAMALKTHSPRRRTRSELGTPPRRRASGQRATGRGPELPTAPSAWSQFRALLLARWWVLALLFLLLGGAAFASTDERFFVYEARIAGAQHVDARTVYAAAGVDEQSIFWIDPQRVAQRVSQLQGIRAVQVRCDLPSSVFIQVDERQPVILWRSDSQRRDWWLDAEGYVLPYHGDPASQGTVFVVDYSGRNLAAGERIEPDGLAGSILQAAALLPGVRVFFYSAERGLYFTQQTENGEWPVYVGDSEDLARKMQMTEVLSRHFLEQNIHPTYVDVRWASRPVYGLPAGGEAVGGN